MPSSSTAEEISSVAQHYTVYVNIFILIVGLIGNILNILVLTNLRIFRGNQCAFYLIVESILNLGQLLITSLSRLLIDGFSIDPTQTSLAWCKIRSVLVQFFNLMPIYTICLAAFDQYLATNPRASCRQISSLKLAQYLMIGNSCFVIVHGIPFLIFFEIRASTGCLSYNPTFSRYYTFFYYLVLLGLLPIVVSSSFGLFAFRNTRRIVRQQVPVVRRRLDRQLTAIVLARVIALVIVLVPFLAYRIYVLNISVSQDNSLLLAINQLLESIFVSLYYSNFANNFYLFLFSSTRYRHQVKKLLVRKYWKSWKRWLEGRINRLNTNRIAPEPAPPSRSDSEMNS